MNTYETATVAVAFTLRTAPFVALPQLTTSLQGAVEFSTLISSWRALQEAIFLYENGMNVYDGGVVHHPPLLVLAMDILSPAYALLYPLLDAYVTYTLILLAKKLKIGIKPWIIGLAFAANPISVLANNGLSTMNITNAVIITGLYQAVNANAVLSAFMIAIAGYLSYTPIFLALPLCKVVSERGGSMAVYCASLVATLITLFGLSYQVTGDWKFLNATYGTIITFSKIAPNLGLWWYFFTEMFSFFIPFYTLVFNLFNIAFIAPLTINTEGVIAFIMSLGCLNFGKPYPELTDLPLYLSFLLLLQPYFKYLGYPLIYVLLFVHSIILSPIFYHLWIDLGSGNANFFYAITLVYSLGVAATVSDFLWAYFQKAYYDEHPEHAGKKLSQF